jgi:hypothetical protein
MVGLLGYKIEYGGKAGASTSINLGYMVNNQVHLLMFMEI